MSKPDEDPPVTGGRDLPESLVWRPSEPAKLSEAELNEIAARWPGDDPDLTSWQDSDVETLIENGRICLAELAAQAEEIRRLREALEPFAEEYKRRFCGPTVLDIVRPDDEWLRRAAKAMEG